MAKQTKIPGEIEKISRIADITFDALRLTNPKELNGIEGLSLTIQDNASGKSTTLLVGQSRESGILAEDERINGNNLGSLKMEPLAFSILNAKNLSAAIYTKEFSLAIVGLKDVSCSVDFLVRLCVNAKLVRLTLQQVAKIQLNEE